jgi:hypothetical protein
MNETFTIPLMSEGTTEISWRDLVSNSEKEKTTEATQIVAHLDSEVPNEFFARRTSNDDEKESNEKEDAKKQIEANVNVAISKNADSNIKAENATTEDSATIKSEMDNKEGVTADAKLATPKKRKPKSKDEPLPFQIPPSKDRHFDLIQRLEMLSKDPNGFGYDSDDSFIDDAMDLVRYSNYINY